MKKVIFTIVMLLLFVFLNRLSYSQEMGMIQQNQRLEIPGDPYGHLPLQATVFGFSQSLNQQEDPQVYNLSPDVNMRAWQKWDTYGRRAQDYSQRYIDRCKEKGILFIAGGTASVVFADEAANKAEFMDWATRDAQNELVQHNEIVPNAYRASMASPAYRQYLVALYQKQIDLGVDGLFLDEADAGGYNGGPKWHYNGNEGYDDYFIADFNCYLINKYPQYTEEDWIRSFGMTPENVIHPDQPYNDLKNNFNYRTYLKQHGWTDNPKNSDNPLAKEWGALVGNRLETGDSFLSQYMTLYWRDIVIGLRNYARKKYGREILITSNGIFPFVDFNSVGLYNYNHDDQDREADYVPVINGRLNGSKSLMGIYLSLLDRHRRTAGNVPLVLFIDWPTEMMKHYYNFSAEQKKDYWRIYAAEAYACGLRFALHLKTSMPEDPTASQSGVLEFLKSYSNFYKENAALYQNAENIETPVTVDASNVAYHMTAQPDRGRYLLHLINHNYRGKMTPQKAFTVTLTLEKDPQQISLVTPDGAAVEKIPFQRDGDKITFRVERLDYYDVLVINTK